MKKSTTFFNVWLKYWYDAKKFCYYFIKSAIKHKIYIGTFPGFFSKKIDWCCDVINHSSKNSYNWQVQAVRSLNCASRSEILPMLPLTSCQIHLYHIKLQSFFYLFFLHLICIFLDKIIFIETAKYALKASNDKLRMLNSHFFSYFASTIWFVDWFKMKKTINTK